MFFWYVSGVAQRQYQRAIDSLDTVVREYPDSNKRSDAYMKKAMSLENMDRRSEAMMMYELVIEQFPRTQHQRIARSRLEGLMRTTPPRYGPINREVRTPKTRL